ncbi:MAG TPA: AGE family epimerase/isomerase, partial [Arachidicoccus soli]|nr:AGE family epimerase/isomerase [Arachidicoccus soli]
MTPNLIHFKSEVVQELEDILSYWENYAIDYSSGGFYGEVSNINIPVSNAEKGSVLNARILWTFASAYNFTKDEKYLAIAERAYKYIIEFFIDKENGGVYWTVDNQGNPTNEKKQIYAQAFCIYGLSEYYKATNNTEA